MAGLDLSKLERKFGKSCKSKSDGKKQESGNIKKKSSNSSHNAPYVGAPYNFVPFYSKVVPVENEDMPVRGCISDDLLSGEINYSIKAETPIFIDDGTEAHEFYKNIYGVYAIPGSSVRGLIRSHAQILGLSSFDDDIDDYRLMHRNVASGTKKERKEYGNVLGAGQIPIQQGKETKQVSVLKHVKGGYIKNEGGKYYIYPTEVQQISSSMEEMNYYVLSERHIQAHIEDKEFTYFANHKDILQHDLSQEFVEYEDKNDRKHYKGTENKDYIPGYYAISYEIKNLRNITAVGEPGEYTKKGYLVFTGKMNEKKAVYIIPQMVQENPIEISKEDVKAYLIDFKKKETTLETFGGADKFALPKDGEVRPVFYIRLKGRLYFGYTPRLRLFYDHTIKEGYKQEHTGDFDLVKSIFGCTGDTGSFKSKVSFSDAVVKIQDPEKEKKNKVVLGEPKPSSYMDYLEQSGGITTYNDQDFVLRGVKQYWLRKDIVQGIPIKNEKVGSVIKGLSAGNIFYGRIRFQNLKKTELGLLLWCLRLEKDSQINIGKAKAYGYGRCSITDISLRILDNEKAYALNGMLDLNPFKIDDNIDKYIDAYKEKMSGILGAKIQDIESVKTFFLMKNAKNMPDKDKIRYMSIDKKEYQNRKAALQKPGELVTNSKND